MITMWNVMFITVGILFFFNQSAFAAKEIAGEIVSVNGIVFIRQDKATGPLPKSPPRAKAGENVYVGDVINTSSEGAVKILMRDKSIVDLGASSLFKVDEYLHKNGNDRKAKLNLMFGKVRVAVTKKIADGGAFQVKTKGATMGVRGTEFSISEGIPAKLSSHDKSPEALAAKDSKKEQTTVTVFQGKVDVAAAPKASAEGQAHAAPPSVVSLTAGTQISTGANVVDAKPVKLSETQLSSLKADTKIMDNTFDKAVTIDVATTSDAGGGRSPASEGGNGGMGELLTMVPDKLPEIQIDDVFIDVAGTNPINQPTTNINSTMKRVTVTVIATQ